MKVRALVDLHFKTSKGDIFIKPGQVFKPSEPEKLIKAGLVESVILPPDQSGRPFWQRLNGSCMACNSSASWISIYGIEICSLCHPPAYDRIVARIGNA